MGYVAVAGEFQVYCYAKKHRYSSSILLALYAAVRCSRSASKAPTNPGGSHRLHHRRIRLFPVRKYTTTVIPWVYFGFHV
ncbi:hypothetical protein KCP73_04115 [Salmonella enterica subsp. enterica]|nr:hypothetical protein KCP73_04115 [Salmonella enterica subsp. enterica]